MIGPALSKHGFGPGLGETGPMDHGAIVVGGGHNGLICAAYLAAAGLDTVLVEARDSVGGCSSTEHDLGAHFNICNCDHTMFLAMPIREELALADHGLEYLMLDPIHQHLSWSGSPGFAISGSVDDTTEWLRRSHPTQVDGYRRYVAAARPMAELVVEMSMAPPTVPTAARRVLARRGKGVTGLLRWSRMSVADVLGQFFTADPVIAGAITTGPAVWGVSPYFKGTGLGALSYAFKHVVPAGRPVGGSGALPASLASAFAAAGGTVRTGARMEAIVCDGDRVRGVQLADGSMIEAGVVVVATDPREAFVRYLRNPPAAATGLVNRWRASEQHEGYESKLDAVISVLPRYRGYESLGLNDSVSVTTAVSPSVAGIAAAHGLIAQGRVADEPMLLANVPSVLDPSMCSAEGHHVLSLEALFTPYRLQGGWPGSNEPARWLERYASLLDNGDEFLSGIQRYRAMTPDVYESQFQMPKGYATSFAGGPLAALIGRSTELTRYQTPVKGLYLTGAATFPGAGIWGAAGRNAAKVVLATA